MERKLKPSEEFPQGRALNLKFSGPDAERICNYCRPMPPVSFMHASVTAVLKMMIDQPADRREIPPLVTTRRRAFDPLPPCGDQLAFADFEVSSRDCPEASPLSSRESAVYEVTFLDREMKRLDHCVEATGQSRTKFARLCVMAVLEWGSQAPETETMPWLFESYDRMLKSPQWLWAHR